MERLTAYLRANVRARTVFIVLVLAALLLGIWLWYSAVTYPVELAPGVRDEGPREFRLMLSFLVSLLLVAPVAVMIASILPKELLPPRFLEEELARLQEQRRQLAQSSSAEGVDVPVEEAVRNQLLEIRSYHVQVRLQAQKSFHHGLFATGLGSLVIFAGVALLYIGSTAVTVSVLSAVVGILMQVIGGSNLYLYRLLAAQSHRSFLHLSRLQDTVIAIKIAADIQDASRRDAARELLLTRLVRPPPEGHQ